MWPRRAGWLPALGAICVLQDARAQLPWHERGPGELLPPPLRRGEPAGRLDADLTWPTFLWAFHRDSLLPPTEVVGLPEGTASRIAAALLAASRSPDEELRWQSLWALARIARHDPALSAALRARVLGEGLLRGAGTVAEVALVAAGLAARGDGEVLAALSAIATDAEAPARNRAFAFYGLGLAAQESREPVVQFRVLAAVERSLLPAREDSAEVLVAALHALALTRIDVAPGLPPPALELLERAWREDAPPGPIDFRAHVPVAVAALVDRDDAAAESWRERFVAVVDEGGPSWSLARSCVLALGSLCRPWEDPGSAGAARGEWLRGVAGHARDLQQRNYALFAMGLAGGARHREFLEAQLGGFSRAWAAFGLAALSARLPARDEAMQRALEQAGAKIRDPAVRESLLAALRVVRREPVGDPAAAFLARYGVPMPGAGDPAAGAVELVATLADDAAPLERRRLAAVALGHLADPAPRHWSARLAHAIDYRSGTAVLLARPNGVLRLP